MLLTLRAFSSGCTALTGAEAISNGVPAFRPPKARNAAQTMAVMGGLSIACSPGSLRWPLITHVHYTEDACQPGRLPRQLRDR